MKKLLLVITILLVFMISGCGEKDGYYYCQITGKNVGGYEVWEVVEFYEVEDNKAKLYKENDSILEYDLDSMLVLCIKMEEIE